MEERQAGAWKLIVGLGNPGWRYRNTRHNAGFLAVRAFARSRKWKLKQRDLCSRFITGRMGEQDIVLALPQTYMNRSGEAVSALLDRFPAVSEGVLVVVDDFHLPLGSVRIRRNGSSGGHHGLESIERHIGRDFARMRLGIGPKDSDDIVRFVLGRFRRAEKKLLRPMLERSVLALEAFVCEGIEAAAGKWNFTSPPTPLP